MGPRSRHALLSPAAQRQFTAERAENAERRIHPPPRSHIHRFPSATLCVLCGRQLYHATTAHRRALGERREENLFASRDPIGSPSPLCDALRPLRSRVLPRNDSSPQSARRTQRGESIRIRDPIGSPSPLCDALRPLRLSVLPRNDSSPQSARRTQRGESIRLRDPIFTASPLRRSASSAVVRPTTMILWAAGPPMPSGAPHVRRTARGSAGEPARQ